MEIVQVKTSELVPYERNAKEHPQEQVEQIANSIKAFGFRNPIIAWKDGTIISGHGRLLASYKLGLEEVPVIYADDLTEEEANALRLADNKTAESSWDEFLLADELASLFDFGMERFGFELLDDEPEPEVLDDEPGIGVIVVTLNCGEYKHFLSIKERLENLIDEIGGTLSIKQA